MQPDLQSLSSIVVATVREALVDCDLTTVTKDDGSVVTQTDFQIQKLLIARLGERWPEMVPLGEEMEYEEQVRLLQGDAPGVWAIDPVDGTTNFSCGFPLFATSVALVINKQPVLGVVYDPMRGECFSAAKGKGAHLNGEAIFTTKGIPMREALANVDYKRLTGQLAARLVRSPPYRSQRNLGTSVLEWCWLAAGRFHLYLHGGQKIWDYAAGCLILTEAGGAMSRFDGGRLDCRSMAKRSVIAAADQGLFQHWYEWVGRNSEEIQRARSA